jgi:hypothetical protein
MRCLPSLEPASTPFLQTKPPEDNEKKENKQKRQFLPHPKRISCDQREARWLKRGVGGVAGIEEGVELFEMEEGRS